MNKFVPNELPVSNQGCASTFTQSPVNPQPHFPTEINQITENSQTFFLSLDTFFHQAQRHK